MHILMLLLGVGAIINVALVWTLSQVQGVGNPFDIKASDLTSWWRFAPSEFADRPNDPISQNRRWGFRTFVLDAEHDDQQAGKDFWEYGVFVVAGYPTDSMAGYRFIRRPIPGNAPWVEHACTFLRVRTPADADKRRPIWLPLLPLWPGFVINTIFYATILWLIFVAPGKVRRWRRMKRGLCPACAYQIGTSPVCTECGKPVVITGTVPTH